MSETTSGVRDLDLSQVGRERRANWQDKHRFAPFYERSAEQRCKIYTRLERLADKLEGIGPYAEEGPIPDTLFNLDSWSGYDGRVFNGDMTPAAAIEKHLASRKNACGTTACACGWAATDPAFQAIGLRFNGRMNIGWGNVMETFLIPSELAYYLFSPSSYEHGKVEHVANRIRDFLDSDYFDELRQ